MNLRSTLALSLCLLAAAARPARAGGDPNECDVAGEEPDVIVGNISDVRRWGASGDITGFSLSTTSCNIGTCWLEWFADTGGNNDNRHPVIGQNMFKLKDGRFEQIGQSWLKHGYFATSEEYCETGCFGTNGDHLGVNCSDPYSSFLNGTQNRLGPKFEVNPSTGSHPHPVTDIGLLGNSIFKRLQIHAADLSSALNAGASYFAEAQYVAHDDAIAGNSANNVSYRPVTVTDTSGTYSISVTGTTVQQLAAIWAWSAADPAVEMDAIDVPGDGRLTLGARVTDLGGGMWHYEYALHNQTSARAAGSFAVPMATGAAVANIGFHDVDYHSGEPFDGTDWTPAQGASFLTWSTTPFVVDADANALRWGTLYNFRFDLNSPPVPGPVTIGMFQPGVPSDVQVETLIPSLCNEDSICEIYEECICSLDCAPEGSDLDGDGVGQCIDCKEQDIDLWATPGETLSVGAAKGAAGLFTLTWSPPFDPGATTPAYEVIRASNPAVFIGPGSVCVSDPLPTDTSITDAQLPLAGGLYAYLVRATNGCEAGDGGLGTDSSGTPRTARDCP